MNILYLNNVMSVGGVTKCILKLCKEMNEDIQVIVASHGGALVDEFRSRGIKHYEINNVDNKTPINIIKNIKILCNIVKAEKIDIIHSHHRMTTLISKIVSKFTGVRVIHTQHLCIEDKFKLTNIALRNIQTITVSNAAKKILVDKSRLDESKIETIYNTIEAESNNKEIDKKLLELKEKGYFIIAQVSRAVDYKGVYDFINVARDAVKEDDNLRFVFIGDGPEFENMKKKVLEENLERFVYLLGSKNNVIEHLKYVDILLLCSYIEGLPLAPLEAFSQGVPVIATNIDGTNEEIIDNVNGFLVSPKDIEGFKLNILKIYKNENLLQSLKQNALGTYNDSFNVESYAKNHIELYKKYI